MSNFSYAISVLADVIKDVPSVLSKRESCDWIIKNSGVQWNSMNFVRVSKHNTLWEVAEYRTDKETIDQRMPYDLLPDYIKERMIILDLACNGPTGPGVEGIGQKLSNDVYYIKTPNTCS